jgi:hypothetical protein
LSAINIASKSKRVGFRVSVVRTSTVRGVFLSQNVPLIHEFSPRGLAAWQKLAKGGGDESDVREVLKALAQIWAVSASDPRAFNSFVMSKGIDQERRALSAHEKGKYQQEFADLWSQKVQETETLVRAVVTSPYVLQFFTSLSPLNGDLKRFAYRIALEAAGSESRLFVLCALATESPAMAQGVLPKGLVTPSIRLFRSYLDGTMNLAAIPSLLGAEEVDRVERLIAISCQTVPDQKSALAALSEGDRNVLLKLAEYLFRELPNQAFGRPIRLRLGSVLCIAKPNAAVAAEAKALLVASLDPGVPAIIAAMGKDHLVELFESLSPSDDAKLNEFAASIIDTVRTNFPGELKRTGDVLKQFAKSKLPISAVAARYALCVIDQDQQADFEKYLARALREDKEATVAKWIARNSGTLRYVQIKRLTSKIWQSLINALVDVTSPDVLKFVEDPGHWLSENVRSKYLHTAVEVLARSRVSRYAVESIRFCSVELNTAPTRQVAALLSRPFIRTFILAHFAEILSQIGIERRNEILKLFRPISSSEAADLARRLPELPKETRHWAVKFLVPALLEDESISADFTRSLEAEDTLGEVSISLSALVVEDVGFLRRFKIDWRNKRDSAKRELIAAARVGLDLAMVNTTVGDLKRKLQNIKASVSEWEITDSPTIDHLQTAEDALIVSIPVKPEDEKIDQLFQDTTSLHRIATFLGVNSWAIERLGGDHSGRWPKLQMISEQLAKSYVFFAKLRGQAQAELKVVDDAVRIDFARRLRHDLLEFEQEIASYFIFRSILAEHGIKPAVESLGNVIDEASLSSSKHNFLRDPGRKGLLRTFGLGMAVGEKVIGSATVMKSGDPDDRN